MSTVQALLRSQLTSEARRLTDVVSTMNRLLRRLTGDGGYVTCFLAEFDEETRGLTYLNAGHNPPLLFRELPEQAPTQRASARGTRLTTRPMPVRLP